MTPTFNEWKMRWSWSSGATSCFSVYFFLWFYFSVCLRKSNTNSTCTTCIYSVSETWMWMQSNSLEIIFVLCGTIYNEYIFLYIIRNKFVSQQKLNALNHIATQRLCVCVCFSSLASSRSFFFLNLLTLRLRVIIYMESVMLAHDMRKWNLDIICPSKIFRIDQCFSIFSQHFQSHKTCEV